MDSSATKKQFKRSMTRKSHSWWWDSHNVPKNSKWLAENLEKMDDRVKHMLKLIEEDADSFAKKAQLYFQKRPELVHLVEEFYRMYRALAERYDQASGELQKNHSSEIQSQSSLGLSSPTQEKLSQEEDSSSLTDSGSDSDHSSDSNDEDGDEALMRRMAELELELQETKQKLLFQQESDTKITVYERELREANEKMRLYEEDITNLKIELQSYMSNEAEANQKSLDSGKEDTEEEDSEATKLQVLEEELSISKEKLKSLEQELELAKKDSDSYINKLKAENTEVAKLQESLTMVKTSLQERDNEISGLKTAVSDAESEKSRIKGEMSKLLEERSQVGDQMREMESHIRLITEKKSEMGENLRREAAKINILRDERNGLRKEVGKREEKIKEMEKHMEELHMEQVRLRRRLSEMTEEVERKRLAASEVAEQKREAIRQLCMSLDHYKNGYDRLWKVVAGCKNKRVVVLAA